MADKKLLYENLLPDEFIRRVKEFPVAYLPLGTLEWHGLHLPLGSDGLQSQGVFLRICEKVGGVVLPPLFLGPDGDAQLRDGKEFYGMDFRSFEDGYAQQLTGSAYYVEEALFCAILDRTLYNLARAGFKAVIAHGHGPSTKVFAARKAHFAEQYGLVTHTLWELGFEGDAGIQTDHAAENETSLMMALHPELVRMENIAGQPLPVAVKGKDPRKTASARLGEELICANVAAACEKLTALAAGFTAPDLCMDFDHIKDNLRK